MRERPQLLFPIAFLLIAIILFFSFRYSDQSTDGFSPKYLLTELVENEKWKNSDLSDEELQRVQTLLVQEFFYLGKGAQSYVFLSRDGTAVIKFFKFKHVDPHPLLSSLPNLPLFDRWKERKLARKERLTRTLFDGYQLAFEAHRSESALIYLHIRPTSLFHRSVVVYDKAGNCHDFDLDRSLFVLQESVLPNAEEMRRLLSHGEVQRAKERIHQIVALYKQEYQKGIYDKDRGVLRNTGFIGERPIHLDIGKLVREPAISDPTRYSEDLRQAMGEYDPFFREEFPEYADELRGFLAGEIAAATANRCIP